MAHPSWCPQRNVKRFLLNGSSPMITSMKSSVPFKNSVYKLYIAALCFKLQADLPGQQVEPVLISVISCGLPGGISTCTGSTNRGGSGQGERMNMDGIRYPPPPRCGTLMVKTGWSVVKTHLYHWKWKGQVAVVVSSQLTSDTQVGCKGQVGDL